MAGQALMRKGLAPRNGMLTESRVAAGLDIAPLENLVFGGWDLNDGDAYSATLKHDVLPRDLLEKVKEELLAIKPWPAVASPRFLGECKREAVMTAREEVEQITKNMTDFQRAHDLQRLVMINLASTERYCEIEDVHKTLEAFEAGLDSNDPRISPSMKYLYAAIKLGVPHCNFAPSRTRIPALEALALKNRVPIAGEDGKTGQTLLKTALAPMFSVRQLVVEGWFSTNILGNNDGKVLDDPASNKTKVLSKQGALDEILGYAVPNHQVHIHYYRPRGDAKEAWDNIDIVGFLGERMQIKVNFLCKDSILAAPLVIDLARFLDVAKRAGEGGIQRQLSLYFKSPYFAQGTRPEHDLFQQYHLLEEWIAEASKKRASLAAVS